MAIVSGPISAGGGPKLATRLLAASGKQMAAIGASFKPKDRVEVDPYRVAIRGQLGEGMFDEAWAEGNELTLEQALAMALVDNGVR